VTVAAVYPGSFDPVTYGHLDVVERAASHFDRLVVACLHNESKRAMFSQAERLGLLRDVTAHLGNVEVVGFEGLLVHFCQEHGIGLVVKGLRAVSDFEYELQMAQMNHTLAGVETLFLTTSPVYSFLSSSLVKEVARFGGDVGEFVPPVVAELLRSRAAEPSR
jgi:pantetheine-phosphate adenylyltransferase